MDYLSKAKIPVAVGKINKFDKTCQHLTTHNFMEFTPTYVGLCIPRSKSVVKHKSFVRCLPLDKPCLGSVSVHSRAFFVPYPYVWMPFRDWYTEVPHVTDLGNEYILNVPYMRMSELQYVFLDSVAGFCGRGSGTPDFTRNGTDFYLTAKGRRFYKLLTSLGYVLPQEVASVEQDVSEMGLNALPLLAVAKVYMDWYFPSSYSNYGEYAILQGIFNRQGSYKLSVNELILIGNVCSVVAYSNDFFTSCWDKPVGPNSWEGVTPPSWEIQDVTSQHASGSGSLSVGMWANGTPFVKQGSVSQSVTMSQYMDSTLKALTNYCKRNQLVGNRFIDRWLATFGIQLSNAEARRSYYLGEDTFPIEIGDVMSYADTANLSPRGGASLGAYSGKGVGYSGDGKTFEFEADDFGLFIVVTTFVPDIAYTRGIPKHNLALYKKDWFLAEFDALGPDAVSAIELDATLSSDYSGLKSQIFGFAPRFYDYKIPYNRVSGDFARYGALPLMQGWSTIRNFSLNDSFGGLLANVKHSLDFMLGKDADQFNRIFLGYAGGADYGNTDGFIAVHRDDVEYYAPMKPLYDSYEFEEEENHASITFEPNGVKMN